MDHHRDEANLQYNGCLVLLNLVHLISELDDKFLNSQTISSVIELSFSIIFDCLRTHGSGDNELQKRGVSLGNYQLQVSALDALIIMQEVYPKNKSILTCLWFLSVVRVMKFLVGLQAYSFQFSTSILCQATML